MGFERVRSTICWVYRLGRAPQPAGALLPTQTSALVVGSLCQEQPRTASLAHSSLSFKPLLRCPLTGRLQCPWQLMC